MVTSTWLRIRALVGSVHPATAAFAGLCVVVGAVRFRALLVPGAPGTVDAANWLTLGHSLLGHQLRSSDVVYPPAVPLLVVGAVALFGTVAGVSLVATVSSLAPAAGVFVVLRWSGQRWSAVALAALVASAATVGEPAAWGGFPQLIGLGLAVPLLWQLDAFRRTGSPSTALASGLLFAGVLSTSHLVAVFAASGIVLVLGLGAALHRGSPGPSLLGLLLLVAPSLPLVPLYLQLSSTLIHPAGLDGRIGGVDLWRQAQFVFRDLRPPWMAAAALAAITPVLLLDRRRLPLWTVTTSLLLALVTTFAVVNSGRVLYLASPAVVLSLGLWTGASSGLSEWAQRGGRAILATAVVAQGVLGLALFPRQLASYRVLSPEMVTALEWLRTETRPDSLVATPALRNVPFGWWVEGLGRRPALTASPLRLLYFEGERARARLANEIFLEGAPTEPTIDAARQKGVDYVLVPKSWDRYSASGAERLRARAPALVAYENEAAIILRVPDATPEAGSASAAEG